VPVKIITDSTSDITDGLAKELGVTVIPLTVSFGSDSYLDRVEMTTDDFYHRLTSENIFPKTTQPSPNKFAEAYDKLATEKDTEGIIVIVISGKLSGTYQSATGAKEITKAKCRIEVIDSLTTAMGLGLQVIAAAKQANSGAGFDEVLKTARDRVARAQPVMSFDTLKYLAKGGRIGKAQGLVGSLLSVKPILTTRDGEVAPLTRVRSMTAGAEYLYNFVAGHESIEGLAVEHATTPDAADKLTERLGAIYPREKIYRSTVSPVLGTYMGPNVLSVSVLAGEKK
jgi:DegV family protein with EDD domain